MRRSSPRLWRERRQCRGRGSDEGISLRQWGAAGLSIEQSRDQGLTSDFPNKFATDWGYIPEFGPDSRHRSRAADTCRTRTSSVLEQALRLAWGAGRLAAAGPVDRAYAHHAELGQIAGAGGGAARLPRDGVLGWIDRARLAGGV